MRHVARRQCYGFATALARDCYIARAIRVAAAGNLHEALGATSTPAFRQLSWQVIGQGQTEPRYDGMFELLAGSLRRAEGFVLHTAHPVEGGWRITEVWRSMDAANGFFAKNVAPNLPPGIHPKRSVQELHSLLIP